MTDFVSGALQSFTAMLDNREIFALIAVGLLGLVIGSFLTVVIARLPAMLLEPESDHGRAASIVSPRSRCPHCRHQLRWHENVPLLSFLALRGQCSNCHAPISPMYPAVEVLAALVALLAAVQFGGDSRVIGALILGFVLIAVVFIDIRHFLIPDQIVLPVLWLGLLCNAFGMFVPLKEAVFGAAAGYMVLWSIYWVYRTVTGKEGMGYGDFKLAALLGAWLGIKIVPVFLVLAFAGGALVGIGLMFARRATGATAVPFGPFLAVSGWISLYWGQDLIAAYWTLVTF